MEPKTFQEAAYLAAKETAELVIMKQMDYGPRNITDFGEYGILVRLNDKLQRLISLFGQGKEPENETIDDTWDDVGGYALVRKMLRRGWFELPMSDEPICSKCGHPMRKGDTYIGESSNIYPIGQLYYCDFCGESIGITSDGRVTNVRGEADPLPKPDPEDVMYG